VKPVWSPKGLRCEFVEVDVAFENDLELPNFQIDGLTLPQFHRFWRRKPAIRYSSNVGAGRARLPKT